MFHTRVVIIGAGQAGLAVSKQLTDAGVDHVVLERGRTAERWRPSVGTRCGLLTPNWMSRLPGWSYRGTDPPGSCRPSRWPTTSTAYADSFGAPVVHGAEVRSVRRRGGGYQVVSDAGSGPPLRLSSPPATAIEPAVPAFAGSLAPVGRQITPDRYRNPGGRPGRWRARRRGLRDRSPARRRAGRRRKGCRAGRRPAHPAAPPLPGHGHHVVAGLDGRARPAADHRAVRPAAPEPSLQIVGSTDGRDDRPALAGRARRQAGRPGHRCRRSGTDVRRRPGRPRRPPPTRSSIGCCGRIDHFAATTGLDHEIDPPDRPRQHRRRSADAPATAWRRSTDPRGHLGDRLPPRLPVAARAGARRRRRDPTFRGSHARRPDCS